MPREEKTRENLKKGTCLLYKHVYLTQDDIDKLEELCKEMKMGYSQLFRHALRILYKAYKTKRK